MPSPAAGPPISAITLFTPDLAPARTFYADVLGLSLVFEDPDSVVFRFGEVLVNLLLSAAVPELISPAEAGAPGAGASSVITVQVDDVDEWVAEAAGRGLALVNGPMDRPWGPRTACFADPSGHLWEVAGPALG